MFFWNMFWGSTGAWTQGLTSGRQVPYHWSHSITTPTFLTAFCQGSGGCSYGGLFMGSYFIPCFIYLFLCQYQGVFVTMSLIQFKIRNCDTTSFALFSLDCFGYSGSFVFPYDFWIIFSSSVKNVLIVLNL
jgi:hypothetical protein